VTTLGRDLGSSVVLGDPYASTHHAVLTFRGREWYVEDLGSTNGTFVGGATVGGLTVIGYGDEIQIGDTRLRLERGRG
jgi:pSer/pThr/pTyr-binding forkhead associated (FHA) protein